ncbi:sensor histidine kinase [Paraburkholderia sp. BCC1884]|uniref:sensor histidine kinase n=1 Tax=Paraburkholderia sp. BCC1884 TaxID=2562668 RepID=UPI001182133C|nr:ATP-binding protein [Paraburkholderia sp. BCC1884]
MLGTIVAVCFESHTRIPEAGFWVLIAVVTVSLADPFRPLIIFSIMGTLLLELYFTQTSYGRQIEKVHDLLPLVPFLALSITVVLLAECIRQVVLTRGEQTQKFDMMREKNSTNGSNDITQKDTEYLHQNSQALYLAEVEKLSQTGGFGWNVETGEIFWSEQAFAIFERDPAFAPDLQTVRELVHPEDLSVFERMLCPVNNWTAHVDLEHRLLFPDGRVKYLHIVANRIPGLAKGRQFIGAVMDVTETRRTEVLLHQAQHILSRASRLSALGELSASIAHEMGQPLTSISVSGEACLRWLNQQPPDIEEVAACVTKMAKGAHRAAAIVQRILRLMNEAPTEPEAVSVNDLVDEVATVIRDELEDRNASLKLELTTDLPDVLADRVELQQVLINLILNGAQSMAASQEKRELTVTSSIEPDGSVALAVRDNGTGISEENMPRLFEAFFTTRSTGMGMGLTICSSIMKAHGGRIWASNNADVGATFTISLPPVRAHARAIRETADLAT